MPKKKCHIDIESRSPVDLKKSGVHVYAEEAEVLICCWAVDDGEIQTWTIHSSGAPEIPMGEQYTYIAHNSQFERLMLQRVGIYIGVERWDCTATRARMMNLPASLDGASKALGLSETKDKRGAALIRKFSIPQKDGTYNESAGEMWDEFVRYCQQDVVVERELDKMLFPLQEVDMQYWHDDQHINDKGIVIDQSLVTGAIAIDTEHRAESMQILKEITGLENPNSVQQMKGWLNQQGLELPDMTSDTIKSIDTTKLSTDLRTVIEIRKQLAQTASKKYAAIEASYCKDAAVRGVLQYYGASQSGRWAGRRVQPQNLPRGVTRVTQELRDTVTLGNLEWLRTMYGSDVQGLLGTTVRSALIPPAGSSMIVSDYSQIECRVLAWLAGEEWALEEFRGDAMIYEATAAQMYGVDKHSVTKEQRQNGKGATLGCIAEGELVLTDCGLVPIEQVTLSMLLWDGVEFVDHDGVIFKGHQEVIEYDGLRATKDHIVFTNTGECEFHQAAKSRKRLTKSGAGRKTVWVGEDNQPRTKIHKRMEWALRADTVYQLSKGAMDKLQQPLYREVKRLPELFYASCTTQMAHVAGGCNVPAMQQPQQQAVQELRCKGDRVQFQNTFRRCKVDTGEFRGTQRVDTRPNRQQRTLRTREPQVRHNTGADVQQENDKTHRKGLPVGTELQPLFGEDNNKKTAGRKGQRNDSCRSTSSGTGEAEELERDSKKARVYDILNAGKRHRFTVSNTLVHNCGYGGGAAAVENFGISPSIAKNVVSDWRDANQKIVRYWGKCMAAAKRGGLVDSNLPPVRYRQTKFGLECALPSGRTLYYPGAKYDGDNFIMGNKKIWGGLMVENICQAVARDLLAYAIRNCLDAGLDVRFHVHDEIVIYGEDGDLKQLEKCMCDLPDWAKGLPVDADGYSTKDCYRK